MIVSTTIAHRADDALRQALESLALHVDRVIVLWTAGPDALDGLAIILSSLSRASKLILWPWQNHFGAARNAALQAAEDEGAEWVLWCDSDEWIEPGREDINGCLQAAKHACVYMPHSTRTYFQPRAIHLPCDEKWHGRTHEAIALQGPRFNSAHFCDRPKSPEQLQAKMTRDLALLQQQIADTPGQARWHYYLADTLEGLGRLDEALAAWEYRSQLPGWPEETAWACVRAACLLFFRLKQPQQAIFYATRALAHHPGIAEACWLAGLACYQLGRYDHALWWAELAAVHGERGQSPHPALKQRLLFRNQKGIAEGPGELAKWALAKLRGESVKGAEDAGRS
jgi:glycosyltransferase involved in cell wall biosynthesis